VWHACKMQNQSTVPVSLTTVAATGSGCWCTVHMCLTVYNQSMGTPEESDSESAIGQGKMQG